MNSVFISEVYSSFLQLQFLHKSIVSCTSIKPSVIITEKKFPVLRLFFMEFFLFASLRLFYQLRDNNRCDEESVSCLY